ncbi:MAG TPA: NAD+ synthase [Burkholderiaceae bacterium]|jgi:NAD+ synthase (glutamine-hydrolysing)|nr:NAD+ synthase [Burkholderiaceae bacterium]
MSSNVRVAVAQLNCTVGDFEGNSRKIIEAASRAAAAGADLLLTPELSLTGYPPEDLLLRRAFYAASDAALQMLTTQLLQFPDLSIIVGHPLAREGHRFNAASLLQGGVMLGTYCKHDLPNYDVFDEQRYFTPDNRPFVFDLNGTAFGVNICEDTWFSYTPECAKSAGAAVLLVLNGSPFNFGKQQQRFDKLRANVTRYRMPVVYANLVGGQDELVFDGASFVLDADGKLLARAPYFEESLLLVDFIDGAPQPAGVGSEPHEDALVYSALVLGVRDYLGKNNFPGAIIGLSGGVDSALTLAIAVDALGADRVRAVVMPSQFTSPMSLDDAQQMAQALNVRCDVLPIKPAFDAFLSTLAREFRGLPWDTAEENLQARIRGTLLMALSNKYGSIVLTTGNKSETAVGYATLYGDLAGGFAVIKDILKTLVYRLSRYRNSIAPVIPQRILTRAPTAELKANQSDQDSLPPYELLDEIIDLYMQQGRCIAEIVAADHDEAMVRTVVRMIRSSEYKRRQSPIGIRVTDRGFGRDWRYPITNRFREENV